MSFVVAPRRLFATQMNINRAITTYDAAAKLKRTTALERTELFRKLIIQILIHRRRNSWDARAYFGGHGAVRFMHLPVISRALIFRPAAGRVTRHALVKIRETRIHQNATDMHGGTCSYHCLAIAHRIIINLISANNTRTNYNL